MRLLNPGVILLGGLNVLSQIPGSKAFSWAGGQMRPSPEPAVNGGGPLGHAGSMQGESRLPNIYAVAMHELQELESEPLCHRIAARLLVNNCQLLDGKDEATVLTDSGRQVRDFVDSYAASLAICDLERGSFAIPQSCSKFREDALATIPASKHLRLHVSTHEIDTCLAGLAKSDSAWNTWVSYRHKSLRFCEAARSDNEKAQSVRLHQRLTEVLSRLTEGVESELDKRLYAVESRVAEALRRFDELDPRLDRLRDHLVSLEQVMTGDVLKTVKLSTDSAKHGLEDAKSLQYLLSTLLQTVADSNVAAATAHEQALEAVSQRTNQQFSDVMTALTATFASTVSLQDQIESSRVQAADLADRQSQLERGLNRLAAVTDDLTSGHEGHVEVLKEMRQNAEGLRETLDHASTSAFVVNSSLTSRSNWMGWLPYLICPTASLLLGSYGLPPSAARNLGLIALGELAGLFVSSSNTFFIDLYTPISPETRQNTSRGNQSFTFDDALDNFSHIISADLHPVQVSARA